MPQSRFDRMKKMMERSKRKIPTQISDHCLGKCDIEIFGIDKEINKPKVYCNGCGRNMGR